MNKLDAINGKLKTYMEKNKPLLVIIAGGANKNFAPLVTNKPLFTFANKPLIQYTLEMAKRVGLTDILIATGEKNHEWLSTLKMEGMQIKTVRQTEPKGMADALLTLAKDIADRPIIVKSAADIVDDSLLQSILDKSQNAYAVVPAIEVKENFPGGYLKVEGNKAIGIVEKPKAGEEPSNLVILTAHYFSKPADFFILLNEIPDNSDDAYEQALSKLMQRQTVQFVKYTGAWQKLKYSFHVLDVMKYILESRIENHIESSAKVSKNAFISGKVYIDEGATIHDTAVIIGPAYIGKNVMVGQHTLIRQSMVEMNAVVGFGSEVSRSYVGEGTKLHHNYLNDSVLEKHVNPSFGTVTANRRLDGQDIDLKLPDKTIPTNKRKFGAIIASGAFFGVNCMLMPGVSIGENAKIYPGSIVHSALKSNSTLKTLQKQEVIEA